MQEALSCPCVDHIKTGPCSTSFVQAFTCYLKSQNAPQVSCMFRHVHLVQSWGQRSPKACGSMQAPAGCLDEFRDMQKCMSKHPQAFVGLADAVKAATDIGDAGWSRH